ncbi:MAG: menaquinol-cytochrome c reductase cytochrome b/c subunit, partial [Thermoleophilaceae bacterium]|nr:menaquinol-cytochrome c reductase cytochrome b/c subunit [Thermoleophilaceae bacterium]
IPTIWLVLLLMLPFYDRNPERHPLKRPIATTAGILTIITMAYLTVEGALAGSPTQIDMKVAKQLEPGKDVAASSGCLGCHRIGENGNTGPGPPLTNVGSRLPRQAIARTLVNPTAPMPSYSRLRQNQPNQFNQLVEFLSSLRE